uniref:Uncharacterized protein n=1 Tax=Pithovirus LCPAC302 TaxID=2506593 RepID=A0A481Z865_9VIRU|nr:MAG: hypothetical protein LCPAC302_01820 [Pithovirus LCPAC302]
MLGNGYALICSLLMIDKVDFKVSSKPIHPKLKFNLNAFVSRIRPRDYLRVTIVLDKIEK